MQTIFVTIVIGIMLSSCNKMPVSEPSRIDVDYLDSLHKKTTYYLDINSDSMLKYALAELSVAEDLNIAENLAIAYNDVGNAYHRIGNFEKAIFNYTKAELINDSIGYRSRKLENIYNAAATYNGLKQFRKAREKYIYLLNQCESKDSIHRFDRKPEVLENLGAVEMNIAISENNLSYFDTALFHLSQARGIFKLNNKDVSYANCLTFIGNIQFHQGNFKAALDTYFVALDIFDVNNKTILAANLRIRIGQLYSYSTDSILIFNKIKPQEALLIAEKLVFQGKDSALLSNNKAIQIDVYKVLAQIYERQRDYESERAAMAFTIIYMDSLFNENIANKVSYIEGEYEAKLAQQKLSQKLEKERIEKDIIHNKMVGSVT